MGTKHRHLTINGEKRSIAAWSAITGVNRYEIINRINAGWSTVDAVTTPTKRQIMLEKTRNAMSRLRRKKAPSWCAKFEGATIKEVS